jgi:hypothetical protein
MATGRFSPILSPKRRSAADSASKYSEDNDDLPPPPSYASSSASSSHKPSGHHPPVSSAASVSSHRSTTYSNLMSFLDDATASSSPHTRPHVHPDDHDHDRDDVSSISNSTTLSPDHGASSGYAHHSSHSSHRQYIWDDHEAKEDQGTSPALFKPSYHSTAAFSSSLHRHNQSKTGRHGTTSSSSVSSSSSLRTNIEEVKSKVERMKGELKIKNQSIKELQAELSRLTLARGTSLPLPLPPSAPHRVAQTRRRRG